MIDFTWPRSVGQIPTYYSQNLTQIPDDTDTRYWPKDARNWSERGGNPIAESGFDLLAEQEGGWHGELNRIRLMFAYTHPPLSTSGKEISLS